MADAFIYDHVRTPRGRGKPDGALHGVTPIQLAAQTLQAVRDRNQLNTALLDDVVLGCVSPLGEQGADIARVAVLVAGYDEAVPGQQLNRFCASGLEAVNNAAAQVMSGQSNAVVAGGVESMSRVPMGSDGGAWATDPAVAYNTYFVPQGVGADLIATLDGYSRTDVDRFAAESQKRAAAAWADHRFARSIVPVKDILGRVVLDRDEHMRPDTTVESLAGLKPSFAALGEQGGFDAVVHKPYRQAQIFDCMERLLGARFVRAEEKISQTAQPQLSSAALDALPDAVRQELNEALLLLNSERILQVISKIGKTS